jgi:branched-chain amino acid transport system substrate-binding protein
LIYTFYLRRDGAWSNGDAASLETDIPDGGTIQGYGVKFFPPGTPMAGQNERSSPVVMQFVDGKTKISWPANLRTADPVLPLPKGHAFAR